jgi:L-fuconolactonase
MVIVDTHCHVTPYWYEPAELLLFQMDRNGVEKAVLVQIMGQYDNSYQFECEARYPGRFVSVVLVDPSRPDAPRQLQRLAEQGAKGARLRADTRSPGDDPLALWRKADELRLPVTCNGTREMFAAEAFVEVIETFPRLPLIIEHLGSVNQPDGEAPPYPIRQKIFGLARYPNVYMKIHGLGEICGRNMPVTTPFPFNREGLSILTMAYEAFGPDRLMWGSDYPPVSGREGYANALRLTLAEFESKPEEERRSIFGGVARRLYGLD